MINLQEVYARSEEETRSLFFLSVLLLAIGLAGIVFFSPLMTLAIVIGTAFILLSFIRPLWTVGFLALYLPFEPFILKWVPDEIYLFARYGSEVLIYLLVIVVFWRLVIRQIKPKTSPIDFPFVLFIIVLGSSVIINFLDPVIAMLGTRQILRFILVFFVVYYLTPSDTFIRKLTWLLLAVVTVEAGIGISQWAVGGAFDSFLLPSDSRTFADIQLKSAVQQFWDPGSRVFATLGRYDYLGTFLAFFLLIAAGLLYEWRHKKRSLELWWIFLLGLPTLILTYSRSSWFGFLIGFLFIAIGIKKDRRVIAATLAFLVVVGAYLMYSGIVVRQLIDVPQQTVVERFFEAFSYERWRGEYYDLGRLYWIVQTPLVVVPASPFFGHGPGTYGGGAASALGNSDVYEELGLPFGVYGTDGYIDNNWLALWGETGTLGLLFYIGMFVVMFRYSLLLYKNSDSHFTRGIALGYSATILAVSLNAFLASFLEARTLAYYFWMYSGFIAVLGARAQLDKQEE